MVAPDGLDANFLKKFRTLILSYIAKGKKFIIIVGGGKTSRRYQEAARKITRLTNDDVDWLGIHASRLNAHLLRTIFRDVSYKKLFTSQKDINTHIRKSVIIAAGFRPGSSTDLRAVQLSHAFKATMVLNLSNIDYVYSKDPKRNKNAKKIDQISWKDFRKIVGNQWDPGANTPFDPVASKLAQQLGKKVIIARGTNINNLVRILEGKKFVGTVIA